MSSNTLTLPPQSAFTSIWFWLLIDSTTFCSMADRFKSFLGEMLASAPVKVTTTGNVPSAIVAVQLRVVPVSTFPTLGQLAAVMGLGILGDRTLTISDSTAFVPSDLSPSPATGEGCGEPALEVVEVGDGEAAGAAGEVVATGGVCVVEQLARAKTRPSMVTSSDVVFRTAGLP